MRVQSIGIIVFLAIGLIMGSVPVLAYDPVVPITLKPTPNCKQDFGDIWDDSRDGIFVKQEIDGSTLKTRLDFLRSTKVQDLQLKIVKGGDFSGWDFRDVPLRQVCFLESKLDKANFENVRASGIGFIKSDLSKTNFKGAEMRGVLFRDSKLTDMMAQQADFSSGQLDGGWFEGSVSGWNIDSAKMVGFKFECGITLADGCPVFSGGDPISARKTNFSQTDLHSFGLFQTDLTDAVLIDTIIGPRQLPYLTKVHFDGYIALRGGDSDVQLTPDEARTLLVESGKRVNADAKPSFDCNKAKSKVEKEICGEYASALRMLDRDVATLYKRARASGKNVRKSQRAWLRTRNGCASDEYVSDCVTRSYEARKSELLALLGEEQWLAPGEEALFVTELLELPAEFRTSPLYAKITSALVGASMTEMLVSRDKDGLYSIRGSAVGANAHTCGLGAEKLYFDKQSGWYSIVTEGPAIPVFQIMDGRLKVFKNGKPDFEKYPDAMDYVSCGMRASFSEVVRIKVDEQTLTKYRKALTEAM